MVNFVTFLQATQNCNGVSHCWFAYINLLKTTLKRWVFLYIFAIFVKSGCTNHAQFTACKHRLDHVSRIHCTFSPTSANHCVHLINERNHFTFGISDFLKDCFETLFEFATVLRTSHQRTDIK